MCSLKHIYIVPLEIFGVNDNNRIFSEDIMNTVYLRIKELADSKHQSLAQIERSLNLSNGSISSWKKSNPSSDKLKVVADYFDVSTDYLLGRTKDVKDPVAYFRLDTSGLTEDQINSMKSELGNYAEYLKHRVRGDK